MTCFPNHIVVVELEVEVAGADIGPIGHDQLETIEDGQVVVHAHVDPVHAKRIAAANHCLPKLDKAAAGCTGARVSTSAKNGAMMAIDDSTSPKGVKVPNGPAKVALPLLLT